MDRDTTTSRRKAPTEMHDAIRLFAASAIALWVASFCRPAPAADDSLWLTSGFWSRHNQQAHYHYRQDNVGIGLSYELPYDLNIMAGTYINSNNGRSDYIAASYLPLHILGVHVGVLGGYDSGYSFAKFYPPVIPFASYEYSRVGINVIWVPSLVIAAQLKVKLADF
jgi:hypothetical protein